MSVAQMVDYDLVHVADLNALCQLAAERHASASKTVFLAGGTDFLVQLSQGPHQGGALPQLVDVSRLAELRGIEVADDTLRIGSAATYLEMQRHEELKARAPVIWGMTFDIGGPTIQARGTLGGNLGTGSPAADGVAALAAYDTTVVVRSVRGERRIALADLQTGYKQTSRAADEVIVSVELKLPPAGSPSLWRKVGTRAAQAISKVAFGATAVVSGGRVTGVNCGMASVAPTTALMDATCALLTSRPLADIDHAAVDAAVNEDIAPIDDIRSTQLYRSHCARAVVRNFVDSLR